MSGASPVGSHDRQVPFYCPYCGEEDLRPAGPAGGSWQCAACARMFELRFAGLAPAHSRAASCRPGGSSTTPGSGAPGHGTPGA